MYIGGKQERGEGLHRTMYTMCLCTHVYTILCIVIVFLKPICHDCNLAETVHCCPGSIGVLYCVGQIRNLQEETIGEWGCTKLIVLDYCQQCRLLLNLHQ